MKEEFDPQKVGQEENEAFRAMQGWWILNLKEFLMLVTLQYPSSIATGSYQLEREMQIFLLARTS